MSGSSALSRASNCRASAGDSASSSTFVRPLRWTATRSAPTRQSGALAAPSAQRTTFEFANRPSDILPEERGTLEPRDTLKLSLAAMGWGIVTKSVTTTDALIFSPVDTPKTPDELPKVFDDFRRCLEQLSQGRAFMENSFPRLQIAPSPKGRRYAVTPILKDGTVLPWTVPNEWNGRVTRARVGEFLRAKVLISLRPPSWGSHWTAEVLEGRSGMIQHTLLTPLPLIDPMHDTARADDERTLPIAPAFEEPWLSFFTPWEHTDGFLGKGAPGPLWLSHRSSSVRMPTSRWWWELRGLKDAKDPERYHGEWTRQAPIRAFLGWPAYLFSQAGELSRCECGALCIQGRRYCGAPDCNRARSTQRKRTSREAQRRISR